MLMKSNKEIYVPETPLPFSIQETEIILKQMKKSICKIILTNNIGTGFFLKVPYSGRDLTVLITNNHLIDEDNYKNNKEIVISYYNGNKKYSIDLSKNRKNFFSKEYDTAILEIFPNELEDVEFLELDDNFNSENYGITLHRKTLYVIQYIKEEDVSVSYGTLKNTKNSFDFYHSCNTDRGSSGSPIFLKRQNKIIGIHTGGYIEEKINNGIFLNYPILEFKSELDKSEKNRKDKKENKKENKIEKEELNNQNKGIFSEINMEDIKSQKDPDPNTNEKRTKSKPKKIIKHVRTKKKKNNEKNENNENNENNIKFMSVEADNINELTNKISKPTNNRTAKINEKGLILPPIKENMNNG